MAFSLWFKNVFCPVEKKVLPELIEPLAVRIDGVKAFIRDRQWLLNWNWGRTFLTRSSIFPNKAVVHSLLLIRYKDKSFTNCQTRSLNWCSNTISPFQYVLHFFYVP
jgi:hypothetical protein